MNNMGQYLVFAPNDVHGNIYLGEHLASSELNAVRRAKEDFEPTTTAQQLALDKSNIFEVKTTGDQKEVILDE